MSAVPPHTSVSMRRIACTRLGQPRPSSGDFGQFRALSTNLGQFRHSFGRLRPLWGRLRRTSSDADLLCGVDFGRHGPSSARFPPISSILTNLSWFGASYVSDSKFHRSKFVSPGSGSDFCRRRLQVRKHPSYAMGNLPPTSFRKVGPLKRVTQNGRKSQS